MFENWSFNEFKKRLDEAVLGANSRNHKSKGQNILCHDGQVKFMKMRLVGEDDIFSLKEMCCGDEVSEREQLPSCAADIFLAP